MPAVTKFGTAVENHLADSISPVLDRLVSRYAATVREAARRHDLSEDDIDEVFQEVRIRIWRALSTREKISVTPASYVYRTAVSAALDLIRRQRARREDCIELLGASLQAGASTQPDLAVEEAELASRLGRALAGLTPSRRVVLRMHLAGYHRNEIAEFLGWTEAKTRNLLYRGLADLKARLESDEHETRPSCERRQTT